MNRTRTRTRAATVAVAVVGAVAVHLVAEAVGLHVTVPEGPGATSRMELTLGPVAAVALLASLAGWAALAVLERVTSHARTAWTVLATAVLVLSLPYLPGFSPVERLVLTLSHLAVGIPLIVGFRRTTAADGSTDARRAPAPADTAAHQEEAA